MLITEIETYIFDMDGVIIDSEPLHMEIESQLFKDLGVEISAEQHINFVGMSSIDMWSFIVKREDLGVKPENIAARQSEKYLNSLRTAKSVPLIPGVGEVINRIYNSGKKLVLASSANRKEIEVIMEISRFKKYFPIIISGSELPRSKPDPLIFIKAGEKSNTLPENCCVIEDSENGVIAAKKAGMHCIGFRNYNSGDQNLSSADIIIDNFLNWH